MGGGGGGGIPKNLRKDIQQIKAGEDLVTFKAHASDYLQGVLGTFNPSDSTHTDRVEEIRRAVNRDVDGEITLRYGGSIKKHTYIDGLSDIDLLIILNDSELAGLGPERAREKLAEIIRRGYRGFKEVKIGDMAVTVVYEDGMEIQALPAIKSDIGVRISNESGTRWSDINPEGFARALTAANERNNSKLIPLIKLVKAINANLPAQSQLSGYHIESLTIEAFKSYTGERTLLPMLGYFFSQSKELVKQPIRDKTRQSLHVDDYLDGTNSSKRKLVSKVLERLSRRIDFALENKDLGAIAGLFE